MSLAESVTSVLRGYARFSGRARRSEFWWWVATYAVLSIVLTAALLAVLAAAGDSPLVVVLSSILVGLVLLAVAVPTIAVTVRRLHDTGRSGWWYLISLVPLGSIVVIAFACIDSSSGPNAYGPTPKPLA